MSNMRARSFIKSVAVAGIAVITSLSVVAPVSAMSLLEAVGRNAYDVLVNGYKIKDINVIEKRTDGIYVVQLPDQTIVLVPEKLVKKENPYTPSTNPCTTAPGANAFFKPIMAGSKLICIAQPPDYYVTKFQRKPAKTKTVPGGTRNDPVCDVSTKTTTHTGGNKWKGYEITEVITQEQGSC